MTLRRAIKRLRLREGDVVIVRDHYVMEQLKKIRIPSLTFEVPIIFAPNKKDVEVKHGG